MICTDSNHLRISFASDLGQSDEGPSKDQSPSGVFRRDTTLLDSSNSDFEFHISKRFDLEDSSPADEIFADGMILPVLPFHVATASSIPKRLYKYELPPIISTPSLPSSSLPPLPLPSPEQSRKYSLKETRRSASSRGSGANSEAEKSSKSFWSFKRSSSLNSDIKKRLICSFHHLTRRNSTGSVINSKRTTLKDMNKHSSQRDGVPRPGTNPSSHKLHSSSSSPSYSSYQVRQQKHVRKNGCIGDRSPFGLGSILRLWKEKKKK